MKKQLSKIRRWMYLIGIPIILGNFFVMSYLFLKAYFHPLKMHNIKINVFGEANAEFILVIVSIPIVIYLLVDFLSNLIPKIWWGEVNEKV